MTALDQLQRIKLADISQPQQLVTIDATATVSEALKKMKDNRVTCLPVVDKHGSVTGILDIRDIVFFLAWGKYVLAKTDNAAPFCDDKVNYAMKNVSDLLGAGVPEGGRVWSFDGNEPVQQVVEPFAGGLHRAVVKVGGNLRIVTQTDIARWIATNSAFAPILEKSLADLGLTSKNNVVKVLDTDSTVEALRKASQNQVTAVAVVDHKNGRLVANLSGSDLRSLDASCVRLVEKPVTAFLAEIHPTSLNPVVVHKDDTLKFTLFKLLTLRVHRVWCIDENHLPTAVITLGDVLTKFSALSPEVRA